MTAENGRFRAVYEVQEKAVIIIMIIIIG